MAISIIQHTNGIGSKVAGVFDEYIPVKSGFSGFFERKTNPTIEIDVRVRRGTDMIAVDVMRNSVTNFGKMTKVTEHKYRPPFFEQGYLFNEDAVYMNNAVYGVMDNPSINRIIADNASKSLQLERDKIERAINLQHAQVLQTGVVVVKNGDSIDYRRKSESIVDLQAGNYWNESGSDITANIQAGCKFLREEGNCAGSTINMIMREDAFNHFIKDEAITAELDNRRIDRGSISMPQMQDATGLTYHGNIAVGDFIVMIWTYNQKYTDAAGETKYYLDAENVILLPTDFVGKTEFGALQFLRDATIAGAATKMPVPIEAEFLVRGFWDDRTSSAGLILNSAPLVVPFTIDKIYTMKVLA